MPLRCVGEGARSEPWIGLTFSRAEAPSHDLLTQSRHKAEDVLAIHEGHVCKSQFVLALHKGLELFGTGSTATSWRSTTRTVRPCWATW